MTHFLKPLTSFSPTKSTISAYLILWSSSSSSIFYDSIQLSLIFWLYRGPIDLKVEYLTHHFEILFEFLPYRALVMKPAQEKNGKLGVIEKLQEAPICMP